MKTIPAILMLAALGGPAGAYDYNRSIGDERAERHRSPEAERIEEAARKREMGRKERIRQLERQQQLQQQEEEKRQRQLEAEQYRFFLFGK